MSSAVQQQNNTFKTSRRYGNLDAWEYSVVATTNQMELAECVVYADIVMDGSKESVGLNYVYDNA